ncbi:succinate dehydrogenase assembly factor 2 [Acidocella sp. C78]|uniref:succinate dehydrogenase assembly factor 2 n=1 Tax=Acidocella sp. C78 TaxID=1671486 RepID=UPI00191BA173|nr:succinate dehydrogenase assembly factor 2 [Acidocella sp. C78]
MTEVSTEALAQRRRRLLYRATHRGTYENDLMIGGFARKYIGSMDDDALDALEAVMEHPDAELADWLTGRKPVPAEAESDMLRRIRDEAAEIAQGEFGAKRGR